ncbi:MAG: metallophosphoesterase, partial [Dehalococcoidia bacterium]
MLRSAYPSRRGTSFQLPSSIKLFSFLAILILTVIVVNLPISGQVAAVDTDPTQLGPQVQPAAGVATPANFKVAFIADSGHGSGQRQVLELIERESADIVLHQGDFSYHPDGPVAAWTGNINNTLGSDFPYIASDGNHDVWSQYIPFYRDRLNKMGLAQDDLPIGSNGNWSTEYQGLKLVFVREPGDASFINQQLTGDDHIWKICSWHKNRAATNVGTKGNEVSEASYTECFDAGAIIAQGHSHTYSRSKTISDFHNLTIDTSCPQDPTTPQVDVCVSPGSSFFFDSSLGGTGYRSIPNNGDAYWASSYTGQFGALFIEFNVDGNPAKARGYFKSTDNVVRDSFVVYAISAGPIPNQPPQVNVGADQFGQLPGPVNISLDGSVTDDGLPETPGTVTTQWSATGPAPVSFADPNVVDTTATFTAEGQYTLTLAADDGELQGSDTMVVNIEPEPVNQAPQVSAGPDQSVVMSLPAVANLHGSVSDDGLPLAPGAVTTSWSASGPAPVAFDNPNSLDTNATFTAEGIYTLTLTADDGELQTSDSLSVTVLPEPVLSAISVSPDSA